MKDFVLAVFKKHRDDRGGQLAALVTYYTFFSLFPLLLVAFTVLGFVLQGDSSLQHRVATTLHERLPLPGIDAGSLTGNGFALAVGLALALWAGLAATEAAQDALNAIWGVPRAERPGFVQRRLRGLATVAAVGVALVLAAVASSVSSFMGPAAGVGGVVISLAINTLIVGAMFKLMVDRDLGIDDIRWGAICGGIGWTALQLIGSWYTHRLVTSADKTYGTFAVVIGLLSWIHLQARVLVLAGEISWVSSHGDD